MFVLRRIPLLAISNQQQQSSNSGLFGGQQKVSSSDLFGSSQQKVSYSQVASKPNTANILDMVDMRSSSNISPLSFGSNSSSCSNSSSMLTSGGNSAKPKMVTVKPSLDDVKVNILQFVYTSTTGVSRTIPPTPFMLIRQCFLTIFL